MDPRNGETLWVRQDFPPGCDIFGDDEYVFVLAPDREEATLLRALDGEVLGTRKVPRTLSMMQMPNGEQKKIYSRLEDNCLATLGRNMLLFGRMQTTGCSSFDPLEGRDLWPG